MLTPTSSQTNSPYPLSPNNYSSFQNVSSLQIRSQLTRRKSTASNKEDYFKISAHKLKKGKSSINSSLISKIFKQKKKTSNILKQSAERSPSIYEKPTKEEDLKDLISKTIRQIKNRQSTKENAKILNEIRNLQETIDEKERLEVFKTFNFFTIFFFLNNKSHSSYYFCE
jgi:vacuolar-type H+-ATPase subunit I/STV1